MRSDASRKTRESYVATGQAARHSADATPGAWEHSPGVAAQRRLNGMIDASSVVNRQHSLADRINTSPRMTAQRTPMTSTVQRALATDSDILAEKNGNFRWTSFEGKRTRKDDGTAFEKGRGATTNAGDKKTRFEWGAVDGTTKEGTQVRARVGPDHNLGTAPKVENALARVGAFHHLSKKDYVSGHLMNEKLGGSGKEARNLTAISGSANGLHAANIEKYVRDPVNKNGAWMHYEVNVNYSDASKVYELDDEEEAQTFETGVDNFRARGVETERNKRRVKVTVRYANRLRATWYPYDVDEKMAAQATNKDVEIQSPLTGSPGKAIVRDQGKSGAASGKDALKTNILIEELVLTKSDLLRPIVESRGPLVARIDQLKKIVADLELEGEEKEEAFQGYQTALQNGGWSAGRSDGFHKALADRNLSVETESLEEVNDDDGIYQNAYQGGYEEGLEEGQEYIDGYDAGYAAGQNDNSSESDAMSATYNEGFERGYKDGAAAGYYCQGRSYSFHNITLSIRTFIDSGLYSTAWGAGVVTLTGNHVDRGNRWYEVTLISTGDWNFQHVIGNSFWMNKAWLWKGNAL